MGANPNLTPTLTLTLTLTQTQEGVGAFFAGVGQRSLYMGPLWAIQFALNGFITNAMLRRSEQREE